MFQRIAARPLALTAALLLFPACDSGDGDGGGTDTDASTSGTTEPSTSTTAPATTTTGSGTTTTATTTTTADESSSTGDESGSSGDESGSSGDESGSSSSGERLVGIADIAGTYIETWGAGKTDFFPHEVEADSWMIDFGQGMSLLTYEEIDDEARWVAGNDGPGSYTRYDWDFDADGNLRYCSAIIAAETLQDAIDAPASDRSDFDGVGCAETFPWSLLVLEE